MPGVATTVSLTSTSNVLPQPAHRPAKPDPPCDFIVRSATRLAGLGFVGLLLATAWQVSIAALFGTSSELDAFWISFALPKAVVTSFHLGILTVVFVLIFSRPADGDRPDDRGRLASAFLNVTLLSTFLCILVILVGAPLLIKATGPGLAPELQALAARMLRLLSIMLIPTVLTGAVAGILHAHQQFVPFALARIVGLSTQIGALYILHRLAGIYGLLWALVLGASAMLIVCLPGLRRTGFRYTTVIDFRGPRSRDIFAIFATFVAFSFLDNLNRMSDRFFASLLTPGSVSALEFGWRFEIPVVTIIGMSVALPSLAIMASQASEKRVLELRQTVALSLGLIALLVLPLVGFLVVFREPLTALWFQREAFSIGASELVSSLIPALAVTFLMKAFGTITVYALLCVRQLKAPVAILLVEVVANTCLNAVLLGPLALRGVVLATAIAMVEGSGYMLARLLKALGEWSLRSLASRIWKPFGVSLCAIALLQGSYLTIGATGFVGGADLVVFGVAYVLVQLALCRGFGLIEFVTNGRLLRVTLGDR